MYTKVVDDIQKLIYWSEDHKPVVFVPGCFDLIHIGHVRLIKFAMSLGEYVIAGVNSDESVRRIKPGRPVFDEKTRAEMVASLGYVSAAYIFHEITPIETILKLQPFVVVKGHDWVGRTLPERASVESYGGHIVFAPHASDVTTTSVIDACARLKATEE